MLNFQFGENLTFLFLNLKSVLHAYFQMIILNTEGSENDLKNEIEIFTNNSYN